MNYVQPASVRIKMSHLQIVVNLGGGEDGVALNGMIGNKATSHNDTMDIAFGALGSNEDFGGMLDLSGMRQNLTVYNE